VLAPARRPGLRDRHLRCLRGHPLGLSRRQGGRLFSGPLVTDLEEFSDRSHFLIIDHGWREVADACLTWLAKQGL
jgi:hypothetical protein